MKNNIKRITSAIGVFVLTFSLAMPLVSAIDPTITDFPIPSPRSRSWWMTTGPDGNVWFTESEQDKVAKITPSGVITEYPIPATTNGPMGITTGPDGNLWFAEPDSDSIYSITTTGELASRRIFPPGVQGGAYAITLAQDGNLWVVAAPNVSPVIPQIIRVNSDGTTSSFPLPNWSYRIGGIAKGPDGNLWFTETYRIGDYSQSKIGRITTSGVITEYAVISGSIANYITTGSDGNLWFTESSNGGLPDKIGRITTSGVITEYALPNIYSSPFGIINGPDGNLWFTEQTTNKIGKITPTGVITEYALSTFNAFPYFLTVGSDNNIWFTETGANKIGRLDPTPPPGAPADLSATTPTQTPALQWSPVPDANTYNVYRNGVPIATTSTTTYSDDTATEGVNNYYVTALNGNGESPQSNTVNVLVDKTAPTITYSISPTQNSNGWNNSDVTVSFSCSDNLSGISSCSEPVTLGSDGANQTVTGTAVDKAGNSTSTSATINIDKTSPIVDTASLSSTIVITTLFHQTATINATVHDALSGISAGEYFVDNDPGIGNGIPLNLSGNTLTGTTPGNLASGQHTISIRSKDKAGNWSTVTTITLFAI